MSVDLPNVDEKPNAAAYVKVLERLGPMSNNMLGKTLNFLLGFGVMMAFFGILLWGVPLLYYAKTGHYLDFGGSP